MIDICKIGFSAWPLWASVIGVSIEFVGFALLGYEIVQTNKQSLREAKAIAAETTLFSTLTMDEGIINDPNSGSVKIEGGILGRLIDAIPAKEKEAARSRALILTGIFISGMGVMLQIAGAFGQAYCS